MTSSAQTLLACPSNELWYLCSVCIIMLGFDIKHIPTRKIRELILKERTNGRPYGCSFLWSMVRNSHDTSLVGKTERTSTESCENSDKRTSPHSLEPLNATGCTPQIACLQLYPPCTVLLWSGSHIPTCRCDPGQSWKNRIITHYYCFMN